MTQRSPQNSLLFASLLIIAFLTVVALWIPSAKQSFLGVLSGVENGASTSAHTVQEQWRDAQSIMKSFTLKNDAVTDTQGITEEAKKQIESLFAGTVTPSIAHSVKKTPSARETAQRKACTRAGGMYENTPLTRSICVFATGSECDAEMFVYGKCHIGQYSKAEYGIPQKPDLILSLDDLGVLVTNDGRRASSATVLKSGDKTYPVPPLAAGASFSVDVPQSESAPVHIDPDNTIQEIIEENNTL